MKVLTCHNKAIHIQSSPTVDSAFTRDAPGWETWLPSGALASGVVHELLFDASAGQVPPAFPALVFARKIVTALATGQAGARGARTLAWIDPHHTLYPPAVIAGGIPANQFCLLRPKPADVLWAVNECLRCEGIAAVIAALPPRPSRVDVRRLQLAAEKGGGVGVFLRDANQRAGADIYAAATRWRVTPAPGERTVQRWTIELLHGHGGRLGQSFVLEKRRDSNQASPVRSSSPLANRSLVPAVS